MHRRAFLRQSGRKATAAVASGVVLAGVAVTTAAAFRDAKPDHVTLSYDEDRLERYVPVIDDPPRKRSDERPQRWHGWIADSPEYEYQALVYVLKYRTQRGVSTFDSHRYDREPVIVYVDTDLEEIREITYTAYHWLAANETAPPTLEQDGGEHPRLQTVPPWNHYVMTDRGSEFFPIEPLGNPGDGAFADADGQGQTTFESWLDTNWRSSAEPGVFQNPDIMRRRESFWKDGRETAFVRAWRQTQLAMARLGIETPRIVSTAPESDLT